MLFVPLRCLIRSRNVDCPVVQDPDALSKILQDTTSATVEGAMEGQTHPLVLLQTRDLDAHLSLLGLETPNFLVLLFHRLSEILEGRSQLGRRLDDLSL